MNLIERRRKLIIFMTLLLVVIGAFVIIAGKTGSVRAANCPMCPVGEIQPATCTEGPKCNSCHYVTGSALGHNYVYDGSKTPDSSKHYTKCNRSGCNATSTSDHTVVAATCTSASKCSVCNYTVGSALAHEYVYDSSKQPDQSTHAMKCKMCGKYSSEAHKMSKTTCEEPAKCSVCNWTNGTLLAHEYVYDSSKQPDQSTHAMKCKMCGKYSSEAHKMSKTTCEEPAKCSVCNYTVGSALAHEYVYDSSKQPDQSTHVMKCKMCGKYISEAHKMSKATCEEPAKCSVCNWTNGTLLEHIYEYDGTKTPDSEKHYMKCSKCSAPATEKHTMTNPTCFEAAKCEVCSYTEGRMLEHTLTRWYGQYSESYFTDRRTY